MTYQVVYPYKWTCIRVTVKLLRMCCRRHCRRAQACYLCTSCCPALSRSPSLPHIPCVRRLRRGTLYGVPLLFDGILVQPIAKKLRLGFRAEQTCPNRASRWLRGRRRLLWRAASPGAGGTGRSAARQAPGERRPSVARASVDCRMSEPVPTSRPRTLTALWVTAASAGRPGRGAASPDAAKCRDVG